MSEKVRNILVAVVICVVLVLAFVFLSYKGKQEEINTQKVEIAKLDKQLQEVEENRRKIQQLEQNIGDLSLALKFATEKLPSTEELTKLLDRIYKLGAVESNISIQRFVPHKAIPREIYFEKPYSFSIIGGFHQILTFLNKIGNLDRIVNIDDIKISPGKNNYEVATFSLKTYIYNDVKAGVTTTTNRGK